MTIAIPTHEDMMLPTLRVLEAHGGSATNDEIVESLVEMLKLTPVQMEVVYPTSGAAIVPDRMTWARSYLKYPGFVDNPKRGVWVLTEEGRTALDWDEDAIRRAVAKGYAAKHAKKKASDDGPVDADGEESIDEAAREWT